MKIGLLSIPSFDKVFIEMSSSKKISKLERPKSIVLFLKFFFFGFLTISLVSVSNISTSFGNSSELTFCKDGWVKQPLTREDMYSDVAQILPQHPIVVEIGVWKGSNALSLFQRTNPRLLILQDAWKDTRDPRFKASNENIVRELFSSRIASGKVKVMKGTSQETIQSLEDGSADLIYIDTTHTYELTRTELVLSQRALSPAGYLCGHDFFHRSGFGVISAVVEFALDYNWTITHISRKQEGSRSFCMRRKSTRC